jgi:hypothetical protein
MSEIGIFRQLPLCATFWTTLRPMQLMMNNPSVALPTNGRNLSLNRTTLTLDIGASSSTNLRFAGWSVAAGPDGNNGLPFPFRKVKAERSMLHETGLSRCFYTDLASDFLFRLIAAGVYFAPVGTDDTERARTRDAAWHRVCQENGWVCRICGAVPDVGHLFETELCDDCRKMARNE